jgi:predicted dehydrogenase
MAKARGESTANAKNAKKVSGKGPEAKEARGGAGGSGGRAGASGSAARSGAGGSNGRGESAKRSAGRVRYAVVGLGYIAQKAVLPAFANAKNSELVALVSSDEEKLRKLGKKYGVKQRLNYEQYDQLLESGSIDAVYIALPNNLHAEFAVRAARAGIHVLCEKPMAVDAGQCQAIIDAAEAGGVKLMIAYRLHFERANMSAIEIVRSGKLGEPRIFTSDFTMQVRDEDNIRLKPEAGGGTLYDIGIYCINAARYLFRSEPTYVQCWTANNGDERFGGVEEMASCILRFPDERLAAFTCSFGAADVSSYRVIGTSGDLRVEPAYDYSEDLVHHLTIKGKTREKRFPKRDQFGPELVHFSDCVKNDEDPEPSGKEGLADVRIIEALYRSAREGRPAQVETETPNSRPSLSTEMRKPAVREPELVHATSPGGDEE